MVFFSFIQGYSGTDTPGKPPPLPAADVGCLAFGGGGGELPAQMGAVGA